MRKIIAMLLALTAAACILTACSEVDKNSGKNDNCSVTAGKEKNDAEDEQRTEAEASAEEETAGITPEECTDALNRIADAVKSGDTEEIMKNCLTDRSCDVLEDFGILEVLAGGLDGLDGDADFEVRIIREADPSIKKDAELQHSSLIAVYAALAEAGVDYDMLMSKNEMSQEQMSLLSEMSVLMNDDAAFARS